MKLHEKYGPVVDITLFGNRFIGTNDPYVAEEFLKENEYFTKKVKPHTEIENPGRGAASMVSLLISIFFVFYAKIVPSSLTEARKFAGTGLFTSDTDAQHWKLAHKLLMPAFSPRAIKVILKKLTDARKKIGIDAFLSYFRLIKRRWAILLVKPFRF